MYTASIVDRAIVQGVLRVKVQYTNGEDSFNDTIETSQMQDKDWAQKQIAQRLKHLNALPDLHDSIEIGTEITQDLPALTAQTEREQYVADYTTFNKMAVAAQAGIIDRDNPHFLALKKKLGDGFKPEYADIF